MRRANAQLQSDRRAEILDAAQRCFSRSGFHQASMQEICAEAGMSPGNLYRYFPSKEAIIAGIAERNRAEAAANFAGVARAPNFFEGLAALARQHLVENDDDVALCAEIMAESRRNREVARLHREIERDIKAGLIDMLKRGAARHEVAADLDFEGAADMLLVLSDGMSWRRSADPEFKPAAVLPMLMHMVRCLLTTQPGRDPAATAQESGAPQGTAPQGAKGEPR